LIEITVKSDDDTVDPAKLKFDWEAINIDYKKGQIDFQVDFSNPVWLSSGDEEDQIQVNILDINFFKPEGPLGAGTGGGSRRRMNATDEVASPPIDKHFKIKRQMPNTVETVKMTNDMAAAN